MSPRPEQVAGPSIASGQLPRRRARPSACQFRPCMWEPRESGLEAEKLRIRFRVCADDGGAASVASCGFRARFDRARPGQTRPSGRATSCTARTPCRAARTSTSWRCSRRLPGCSWCSIRSFGSSRRPMPTWRPRWCDARTWWGAGSSTSSPTIPTTPRRPASATCGPRCSAYSTAGCPTRWPCSRYDIRRPDSEGGGFEVRYWSPLNSPVLDEWRRLRYIIHRVEDVTEFVRLRELGRRAGRRRGGHA